MQKIKLKENLYAIVDSEDFDLLSKYVWHVHTVRNKFYVMSSLKILMHRMIMNPDANIEIDHINGDCLDNRRSNLRMCTHKNNLRNQVKPKNNSSGYKGVTWHKKHKKWRAYIRVDGKQLTLGHFDDKNIAALAYNTAAITYFGEYSKLNEVK